MKIAVKNSLPYDSKNNYLESIFTDKDHRPATADLKKALGSLYKAWESLSLFTLACDRTAKGEWKYSGEKYGWSFEVGDKKRVLVYLLPRDQFFKVGMVFGQKATEAVMKTDISTRLKDEIQNAKVYTEGRGVRIEVKSNSLVSDLEKLIQIKTST
jgi:hypothetical protein